MQICGHLKSGHLVRINVDYHCKECRTAVTMPFWGDMTDAQMDYSKKVVESLMCKTCYDNSKIPEIVECLFH